MNKLNILFIAIFCMVSALWSGAKCTDSPTQFSDVPIEIIRQISYQMDMKSMLKLSMTCENFKNLKEEWKKFHITHIGQLTGDVEEYNKHIEDENYSFLKGINDESFCNRIDFIYNNVDSLKFGENYYNCKKTITTSISNDEEIDIDVTNLGIWMPLEIDCLKKSSFIIKNTLEPYIRILTMSGNVESLRLRIRKIYMMDVCLGKQLISKSFKDGGFNFMYTQ